MNFNLLLVCLLVNQIQTQHIQSNHHINRRLSHCHKCTVPPKPKICQNLGLTWGFQTHNSTLGIDFLSCHGTPASPATGGDCNPYLGDTPCNHTKPVLCIQKLSLLRPPYATAAPQYQGWTGGLLALTNPIRGCKLTSQAAGNAYCTAQLGANYVMAEWHDGYYIAGMSDTQFFGSTWTFTGSSVSQSGTGFVGYSNIKKVGSATPIKNPRFWVAINDQNANCWNSLGHL